jgi:hypothetical protein
MAARFISFQRAGRRWWGSPLRLSSLLMVAAVVSIGVGAVPAGAATCLTVTPSNPTTLLTFRTEIAPGVHACQGYTDAPFGSVSGGVAPYTVTMTFAPDPPFAGGSAGLHSFEVGPGGHIKIVGEFTRGAPLDLAKHGSETIAATVTVADSAGHEQQISDVWTITSDCAGGPET